MRASQARRGRRRSKLITDINFVPFTDVLLVLLVIFMMTARLLGTDAGLDVRLPRAAAASTYPEPPNGVVVTIQRDGRFFVDDQPVAQPDLVRALTRAAADKQTRLVVVRADRAVTYDRIAFTIDSAKLAGLNDLALATELQLDSSGPAALPALPEVP
ncbi:MAG: biopolymer transporter ExbD [Armatimonadota bacterium]|nr:biopolymer transporter ExbD [Armatimonadota bacterium]